jgi:hypothetical protein
VLADDEDKVALSVESLVCNTRAASRGTNIIFLAPSRTTSSLLAHNVRLDYQQFNQCQNWKVAYFNRMFCLMNGNRALQIGIPVHISPHN